MLELNKENPIKRVINFIIEGIKTFVICIVSLFLGFAIFSFSGVSDNTSELTEAQEKLESVQAEVTSGESEKEALESKINELKDSSNKLNEEVSKLNTKLEELKNTKIQ